MTRVRRMVEDAALVVFAIVAAAGVLGICWVLEKKR